MFLKERESGHLVQVADLTELVNPLRSQITGCYHHGEEAQEAEPFSKGDLVFLSGEPLPRCWMDSHYRDGEIPSTGAGV
ncbi:MAG: hypothetical protein ACJASW_002616 [Polaribacter sp.]|jgi:hypothetical protein|uniref:acetyltransferase n=1 Tax=Alcanivorax sp. IL2 TaxID=3396310 RepID=UPI0039C0F913